MIIDCISDLHGDFPKLPGGGVLIIAGDCTTNDSVKAWNNFFNWFKKQKYERKIVVAGNHDGFCKNWCLSDDSIYQACGDKPEFTYLCDSGVEIEGIKFWGSPWSLWFQGINPHCKFFTGTEGLLEQKFSLIPKDVDVLITHCPPHGIFDETRRGEMVGSKSLRKLWDNNIISPKVHVFGHIHEQGGRRSKLLGTVFANVSHLNDSYIPTNKQFRFMYRKEKGEFVG